jgi:hypothetical protein
MGLTISLNRVSFLPPPVRNNIFYEIETSSTGLYNTGLGVQSDIYMDLSFFFKVNRGRIQTSSKEGANRGTHTFRGNRVSFLPPAVRNNIFYEIETSSTGLYNTGLGVQSTGGGMAGPRFGVGKTFKNHGRFLC